MNVLLGVASLLQQDVSKLQQPSRHTGERDESYHTQTSEIALGHFGVDVGAALQ